MLSKLLVLFGIGNDTWLVMVGEFMCDGVGDEVVMNT